MGHLLHGAGAVASEPKAAGPYPIRHAVAHAAYKTR